MLFLFLLIMWMEQHANQLSLMYMAERRQEDRSWYGPREAVVGELRCFPYR